MFEIPIIYYGFMSGAFGGFVNFLFGLKRGHFKNNKKVTKLFIELLGAAVTATFLVVIFPNNYRIIGAFLVGLCWSTIIQLSRKKITNIFQALLDEKLNKEE